MVDFGAPYAMDGTTISGLELRRQLQREAGTGSGVARAGDLKITQMDTPGPGVRIAAGDDLIQCRAPGRDRETYGIPLLTSQDYMGDAGTGLPGTGSGTPDPVTGILRRDMIIHEVLDPDLPRHYTPRAEWPAGAVSKLSVVPGVALSAKTVDDVPELNDVTCVELLAINYPPSTATITDAIVEDLRRVQSPKTEIVVKAFNVTGAGTQFLTSRTAYPSGGQTFPIEAETAGDLDVDIPWWATEIKYIATFSQLYAKGGQHALGDFWIQVGASADPNNIKLTPARWDVDEQSAGHRLVCRVAHTEPIPENLRGTRKRFYPRMNMHPNSVAGNTHIKADWATSIDMILVFQEVPD